MTDKNNSKKNIFLILGITFILVFGVLLTINGEREINIYNTDSENLNLLRVNGSSTKNFAPDRSEIIFSIETDDVSAKESQQENARITSQVITAIKAAGISDEQISTSNYSLRERYEWNNTLRKNELIGYRTTNTIKVVLRDLEKTGSVIDSAVLAGANRVSSISFTLSEEKQARAREEVLKEASANARAKANRIASGLGIKVGRVHSVSEDSHYNIPMYQSYEMTARDSDSPETIITPGDVSMSATVTVQFEI